MTDEVIILKNLYSFLSDCWVLICIKTLELWIKLAFGMKAFCFKVVQLVLMNFKIGLLMFEQVG